MAHIHKWKLTGGPMSEILAECEGCDAFMRAGSIVSALNRAEVDKAFPISPAPLLRMLGEAVNDLQQRAMPDKSWMSRARRMLKSGGWKIGRFGLWRSPRRVDKGEG